MANARNYELEYTPVTTNGTAPVWTKITVATARKQVAVENLTPGMTYMFHVRAFGHRLEPAGPAYGDLA
ncbi:MAG TPA: fibronectin type III domain-containing protein [Terriglobia bacterium]